MTRSKKVSKNSKVIVSKLLLIFGELVGVILAVAVLNILPQGNFTFVRDTYGQWLPIATLIILVNGFLRMLMRVFDSRRWCSGLSFLSNAFSLISLYFLFSYKPIDFSHINVVAGWLFDVAILAASAGLGLGMIVEFFSFLVG